MATPKPANSVPTASSSLGKVEPLQKLSYITERVPGAPRRLPEKSGFSTGRIIPNAKRPVIARKVHSGALPTSIRAYRVGWLDGHSVQRYPATQFVDLAGGISPRHLEANAQPVGNASDIAETDNSDRR